MTTTKTKQTKTNTTEAKASSVAPKVETSIDKLPANPFAFEVLSLVSKQRTNAKKVEVLKKYEHDSLKSIFIWNFDESIISLLPPGDVPYASTDKQNSFGGTLSDKIDDAVIKMGELNSHSLGTASEVGQQRTTLRKEYAKLYNFVKGGNNSLASLRRETMFINILEGLHPLESEILILVKDKKLTDKYKITKEIVSQAYPDIVWGNRN
jgi:hypothetical protein